MWLFWKGVSDATWVTQKMCLFRKRRIRHGQKSKTAHISGKYNHSPGESPALHRCCQNLIGHMFPKQTNLSIRGNHLETN